MAEVLLLGGVFVRAILVLGRVVRLVEGSALVELEIIEFLSASLKFSEIVNVEFVHFISDLRFESCSEAVEHFGWFDVCDLIDEGSEVCNVFFD